MRFERVSFVLYTAQIAVIRAALLSAADIFTYLYYEELNVDAKQPDKPDRDRFVLSKGHVAPGLYAVLAEKDFSLRKI